MDLSAARQLNTARWNWIRATALACFGVTCALMLHSLGASHAAAPHPAALGPH